MKNKKVFVIIVCLCILSILLSVFFVFKLKTKNGESNDQTGHKSASESSTIDYTYLPSRHNNMNNNGTSETASSASNAGNVTETGVTILSEKEKENYFNEFYSCLENNSYIGICSLTDAYSSGTAKSVTSEETDDDDFAVSPESMVKIGEALEKNKFVSVDDDSFEEERQKSTEQGYLLVFNDGMIYNDKAYKAAESDSSNQSSATEESGGTIYVTKVGTNDYVVFNLNSKNTIILDVIVKDNAISKIIEEDK